jgi:hypothetical protein
LRAGITQPVEYQLPKLRVAGSNPVARSIPFFTKLGLLAKYRITLFAVFLPLLIFISCSQYGRTKRSPVLERAIADYISGRYSLAEQQLKALTKTLEGENLCQAYLYLGRCYIEQGKYGQAAEAFNLARINSCEGPIDEYLQKISFHYQLLPENIVNAECITRAQLACLLNRYFAGSSKDSTSFQHPAEPPDIQNHWARNSITKALLHGFMSVLPDGRFYPDNRVSRSSFVYTAAHMIEISRKADTVNLEGSFPGEVQSKISFYCGASVGSDHPIWVSGTEAINILENIARKAWIPSE